jgi:hypothetical protein
MALLIDMRQSNLVPMRQKEQRKFLLGAEQGPFADTLGIVRHRLGADPGGTAPVQILNTKDGLVTADMAAVNDNVALDAQVHDGVEGSGIWPRSTSLLFLQRDCPSVMGRQ